MKVEEKTDEFAAAFEEFSAPEDTKAAEEKPAEEAPVEEAKTEEQPVEEVKDASTGAADTVGDSTADTPAENKTDAPAAEEKPAEEKPVEAAAPADDKASTDTDELINRLAGLVKEAPAAKAEEKPAEEKPAEEAPVYTADEQKLLDDYAKEWPDVYAAEQLRRRGEYQELVSYIFSEVSKVLTPLKETTEALAERTHFADLREVVPDYSDTTRDQVVEWVGKQPVYLQTAYNKVIQEGTVEEVADLIGRYRKETGKGVPAPNSSEKKEPELSAEAKQAAEALAPVRSERTVVQAPEDMSNFDAAFASFAKDDKV